MTSFQFTDGIRGYEDKIPDNLLDQYQELDYDEGEQYIVIGSGNSYSVYADDDINDIIRSLFDLDEEILIIAFKDNANTELLIDRVESGDGVIYIGTVEELSNELS